MPKRPVLCVKFDKTDLYHYIICEVILRGAGIGPRMQMYTDRRVLNIREVVLTPQKLTSEDRSIKV